MVSQGRFRLALTSPGRSSYSRPEREVGGEPLGNRRAVYRSRFGRIPVQGENDAMRTTAFELERAHRDAPLRPVDFDARLERRAVEEHRLSRRLTPDRGTARE